MNSFANRVSYLVNMPAPLFDYGTEDGMNHLLEKLSPLRNRSFQAVIGLNSPANIDGDKQRSLQKLFNAILTQNGYEGKVSLHLYRWEIIKEGMVNYSSIRNGLFDSKHTVNAYELLKKRNSERIYFLSIDPDSQFTPSVLEQFEAKEEARQGPSPHVICGSFDFNYPNISRNLILEENFLNWEGFLCSFAYKSAQALRLDLAQMTLDMGTYPIDYKPQTGEALVQNLKTLTKLQQKLKGDKYWLGFIIFAIRDHIAANYPQFLKFVGSKVVISKGKNKEYEKKHEEQLQNLAFKVQNCINKKNPTDDERKFAAINGIKAAPSSMFLYPAEPVFFATMSQVIRGSTVSIYDFIRSKQITQLFGNQADNEGLSFMVNISKVWKEMVRNKPALKGSFPKNGKKKVDFTFSYVTEAPVRCLDIHQNNRKNLPYTLDELEMMLVTNEKELRAAIKEVLIFRKLSPFGGMYIPQAVIRATHKGTSPLAEPFFNPSVQAPIERELNEKWGKEISVSLEACTDMIMNAIKEELVKAIS